MELNRMYINGLAYGLNIEQFLGQAYSCSFSTAVSNSFLVPRKNPLAADLG